MKPYIESSDACFPAAQFAAPLAELAISQGINEHKLLKGTRLFLQDLLKPGKMLSFAQIEGIIENTKLLNHQGDLGFLLGEYYAPGQTSSAGQCLFNAKHLGDFLRLLNHCQWGFFPYLTLRKYSGPHTTYLMFDTSVGKTSKQVEVFFAEVLAGLVSYLIHWRFQGARSISLLLPYSTPVHIEQYLGRLPFACHFDQPQLLICIPNHLLHHPQVGASAARMKQTLHNLDRGRPGFNQYMMQLIENKPRACLEEVAQTIGMSPSTLKRKLKHHKLTLMSIKDNINKQQALYQLMAYGHTTETLASTMNYSDVNNFRRTFKRWLGMTPNQAKTKII